ncbi:MAG TPA: RNA polymerase sigma factor [Chitinophagales bacterium]|nr:RNA polymerase sigma factor [Chitinophagales bacterium]
MNVQEYNAAVDQYADRLYRFLLKQTQHVADAEDLVQNAFEVLWRNHQDIAADKALTYLFSVAHHQFISLLRKNKHTDYVEDITTQTHQSYSLGAIDLSQTIDEALEQLPDIQRSVLLLRDYEGYSYEEIANITQITESQVKVYIFRARKKMQHLLVSPDRLV